MDLGGGGSGELSDEERCQQRQAQSVPVLKAFKAWLDIQAHAVLPKSALVRAVFYALKNWDALCRYTDQGYLEPDNNFVEQSLLLSHVRDKRVTLLTPDEFNASNITQIG